MVALERKAGTMARWEFDGWRVRSLLPKDHDVGAIEPCCDIVNQDC